MSKKSKLLAIALIMAVVWVVIAPSLAGYLIVERPLASADALIVLSGSSAYKERTEKAAEIYKRGVAERIFITNDGGRAGWSAADQTNPPFVELEQGELIANGVLPDAITVLPGVVTGTEQEAVALAGEIDARPIRSVLIVTSGYHTRRALWTFERVLAQKGVEIGIEHAPMNELSPQPRTWWLSVRGWQDVAGEYVKMAAYWAYY